MLRNYQYFITQLHFVGSCAVLIFNNGDLILLHLETFDQAFSYQQFSKLIEN